MEYSDAAISIGGKMKRSDVEKLAQAMYDDGASLDWIDHFNDADEAAEHIAECANVKRNVYLCGNDQPWGRFERIEAVCEELGLTFKAECEAGGEWTPLLQFWNPGMSQKGDDGKEQNSSREWNIAGISHAPMIDVEDIQKYLDAGTLAYEIALITTIHKFPWPIEIVEDEDESENLPDQVLQHSADL